MAEEIKPTEDATEELTGEILDAMQPPSENAQEIVDAAAAEAAAAAGPADPPPGPATPADMFNPEKHQADPDGNPILNPDGSYKKKRGRPPKRASVATNTTTAEPTSEGDAQATIRRQAAAMAMSCTTTAAIMFFGTEWFPQRDASREIDEAAALTRAWEAYFKERGDINIPPWMVLVVAYGAYAGPRLAMPATQGRIGRFLGWVKDKAGRAFGRRKSMNPADYRPGPEGGNNGNP